MKTKRSLCIILIGALLMSATACGQSVMESGMPETNGITAGAKDAEAAGAPEDGVDGFAVEMADAEAAMSYAADAADAAGDALGDSPAGQATIDESTDKNLPEAGQLTAGEWNDNDNWGFFSNLISSETIKFPSYGIDPTQRTKITVKGSDGAPLVNAHANLLTSDGSVIWSAVTDKSGTAYLFTQGGAQAASVEIESNEKKQSYAVESAAASGEQTKTQTIGTELDVTFDGTGKLYKSTDVMFIVDTTGSMSDEMLFLQSEFTAITKEIGTADTRYSVNFYRDEGDEYITKCNKFSSNVKDIQKKLNNESASGGGDWEEAVSEALTETMFADDWKDESVKLAFLIYDAPPHEEKEAELLKAVEEASRRGIRLIPVVCSNQDRGTELFGRALAITTGGTYVFLTDDSGIGESHQEPIIGSYEVRPLYNIIIDVINSYKQ